VTGVDAEVREGPLLLAALGDGPGLAAHRHRRGGLPSVGARGLERSADRIDLRGRGGAGFPFAQKLRAVQHHHRIPVVVNACEGEPLSAKDSALAVLVPHLVLDGAVLTARALGSRRVHVVAPGDRPAVADALGSAILERDRREDRVRFDLHVARPGFVSGQSRAVIELIEGRDNAPVTAPSPVTTAGLRGRPTLLSNAETYAHLAAWLLRPPTGTEPAPSTTLLTVGPEAGRRRVLEVPVGTRWTAVLTAEELSAPVLIGGYHGRWAARGVLSDLSVARDELAARGLTLGAGVVVTPRGCPLVVTARIATYLAGEATGRCGPCRLGLPALAELCQALVEGQSNADDVARVAGLVTGRGACAHPDGTAAMVGSALRAFSDEVSRHARGACSRDDGLRVRAG
jgi:NADH:ubiquinone oxidoreductase subunit F (NADH-binding)